VRAIGETSLLAALPISVGPGTATRHDALMLHTYLPDATHLAICCSKMRAQRLFSPFSIEASTVRVHFSEKVPVAGIANIFP